ncbi:MAG TPA: hypothetical protein VMV76_02980 [Dehalococcoidia bacterium]|nr:hypothetical protein [Dehalococcoidia bacterium]
MDFVDKLKKFMKFINKKYQKDDVFRSYGQGPWQLVNESGIDFGSARAQLEAMNILLREGLIEVVNFRTAKQVASYTKIRPSLKGLNSTKQDWLKVLESITRAITEGAIKGLRK